MGIDINANINTARFIGQRFKYFPFAIRELESDIRQASRNRQFEHLRSLQSQLDNLQKNIVHIFQMRIFLMILNWESLTVLMSIFLIQQQENINELIIQQPCLLIFTIYSRPLLVILKHIEPLILKKYSSLI